MNNWSYNPVYLIAGSVVVFVVVCWLLLPSPAGELLVAAKQNNTDGVIVQIHRGASVDKTRSRDGRTPLMIAASLGNFQTVKVLLEAGAQRDLRDNSGKTALDYASAHKHTNVVSLLRSWSAEAQPP